MPVCSSTYSARTAIGSPVRGRITRCSSVAVVGAGLGPGFSTVCVMRPPPAANAVPSVK